MALNVPLLVNGAVNVSSSNGIMVITVPTRYKTITPKLLALLKLILAELGFMLMAATINDGVMTLVVKPLSAACATGVNLGVRFNTGVILGACHSSAFKRTVFFMYIPSKLVTLVACV